MMSGKSISNCNIGTLCYSSPEVVRNEEYDYRTDIWSLGCIIYELCTYSMLYNSTNERALIDKICNQKAPDLPHSYSHEMRTIYQLCIHKVKEKRPNSKELLGHESKHSLLSIII
jgi:serine/threonine protein kinase